MAGHGQSTGDYDVIGNLTITGITYLGQLTESGDRSVQVQSSDANAHLLLLSQGTGVLKTRSSYDADISADEDIVNLAYSKKNLIGKQASSILQSPTVSQDQYSIIWDNTSSKFTLKNIASYTINNGLSLNVNTVQLGGSLIQNTTILGNSGTYQLNLGAFTDKLSNLFVYTAQQIQLQGKNDTFISIGSSGTDSILLNYNTGTSILVNNLGITITDVSVTPKGLVGTADYSNNVTSTTFIQKSYADKKIAGKGLSSSLLSPGSGQNGYAITWDNINNQFTLSPSGGGGGGSTTFIGLSDVPSSYSGQSLKGVRVNAGETGLEFYTTSGGSTSFIGLSDVPSSYSTNALKLVRVNNSETALEFFTAPYLTGNQTITLSGDVSGSGSTSISVSVNKFNGQLPSYYLLTTNIVEGSNLFFTTSRVLSTVLSGLSITGGSISSTDSILQAFGKLQNQINGVLGDVSYQGTWNANTNSPSLVSSTGTKGYYYVVSVNGSTNLDGITDWKVGDWAIFNGTTWDKVDNTDAISSFNGSLGAIVYTPTGTTNRITVTGTGGLNPTFDISSSYVGQSSITTLGTITSGTWNATILTSQYGGTGLNTSASTGIAQISSGTWSISTNLANGTTATTQAASDNSTKLATTAYVDNQITLGSYWKLSGTSTLTNTTTITSNTMGWLNFAGTATATTNNQSWYSIAPVLTSRSTASDTITGLKLSNSYIINSTNIAAAGLDLSNIYSQTGGITAMAQVFSSGLSGMTPGTYTNVSLTGGSGSGALFTVVVASATSLTSITPTTPGSGYKVNDALTINGSSFGGSGSNSFNLVRTVSGVSLSSLNSSVLNLRVQGSNVLDLPQFISFYYEGNYKGGLGVGTNNGLGNTLAMFDDTGTQVFFVSNANGLVVDRPMVFRSSITGVTSISATATNFTNASITGGMTVTTANLTNAATGGAITVSGSNLYITSVGGIRSVLGATGGISTGAPYSYTITTGGSGYTAGTKTTTGGAGSGAQVTITVSAGAITSAVPASVVLTGNGYSVGDVLTVSGGTGGTITVASVDQYGGVLSVVGDVRSIIDSKSNNSHTSFYSAPTYTLASSSASTWFGYYNPTYSSFGSGTKGGIAIVPTGTVNGIGTGSPNGTLHLVGNGSLPTFKTVGAGTTTNYSYIAYQSDGTTIINFLKDNGDFQVGLSSSKLGFFGTTAISKITTGVSGASFVANSGTAVNDASTFGGYTIKQIVQALQNYGLLT